MSDTYPRIEMQDRDPAAYGKNGGRSSVSPINILIVDDEPKNLTVLETVLDDPSYRLVRANSADAALLALLHEDFAVLVLDIQMPDVSGFELARIIKTRRKTALVPIIFLTAYYNEDQHVLEGYISGAVDYLHKPVSPAILRSKVAVFAELYRKSREVSVANSALRAEVAERLRAEDQLRVLNATLEQRVQDRTRELCESERLFREMTDALPTAVYTTDAKGIVTHFNPAAAALSGTTLHVGTDHWCIHQKLYRADGTRLAREDCPMTRALQTGHAMQEIDLIIEQPDGNRVWVMTYPTPMLDAEGRVVGGINILVDMTARKRAEDHIRLLMREVNHRSKNMLAVVTAIARQTLATSPANFVRTFSDRVSALAASHDLLVKNEWQGIGLAELVRAQLAHFEGLVGRRIVLSGPPLRVTAAAAQCVGMVVHELATNAAKHGALSTSDGRIEINWQIEDSDASNRFTMQWTECEGPSVACPKHRGFGSTVIKTMVEMNVDGVVDLDYAPSGLKWRLNCPVAKILQAA